MARSNVVYSKLRPLPPHVRFCPDCGGSNIGPVTRCCFDCHEAELRKAGVDLTPIRKGLATSGTNAHNEKFGKTERLAKARDAA